VTNEGADAALAGSGDVADATDTAPLRSVAAGVAATEDQHRESMRVAGGILPAALRPIEQAVADLVGRMFDVYRSDLLNKRDQLPGNVTEVASAAMARAMTIGSTARFTAALLDLVPFVDGAGLQQLVGALSQFAGFDQLTGPIVNPTLKYALAIPSEHQMAAWFQTRMPGPGEALEQAYQRHIHPDDYRKVLRLHGYPDDWISVLVGDMYVDPRARELVSLARDMEVPLTWLVSKFHEAGWDDTDTAMGIRSAIIATDKPGRDAYRAQVTREYARGHVDEVYLTQQLGLLQLPPTVTKFYAATARLDRRGRHIEVLSDEVIRQYQDSIIGPDGAAAMLEALGLEEEERNLRLALAALRRNERLMHEDEAEIESAMGQLRRASLTTLKGHARAGVLTEGQFLTLGATLGYDPALLGTIYADLRLQRTERAAPDIAAVGIEALTRALPPAGLAPATDGSAEEAELDRIRPAALRNLNLQLALGVLDRDHYVSLGLMLGYSELELQQLADVALLQAAPPELALDAGVATEAAAAAQSALATMTAQLVALRQTTGAAAVELLQDAGVDLSVAQAAVATWEVVTRDPRAVGGWPFGSTTEGSTVWAHVIGALARAVTGGFAPQDLPAQLLARLGIHGTGAELAMDIIEYLIALFGGRRPHRTRDKSTVTPPIVPFEPIPADKYKLPEPRPRLDEPVTLPTLPATPEQRAQLAAALANLEETRARLVALGGKPPQCAGTTPAAETRAGYRDAIEAAGKCLLVTSAALVRRLHELTFRSSQTIAAAAAAGAPGAAVPPPPPPLPEEEGGAGGEEAPLV
jgi:hypothetical protein